jgi:hypothetical protein
MPQYRTIPLIWIDPKAIKIIRKSDRIPNEIRNIYFSLCEMEFYSLLKFKDKESFLLCLVSCSGEEKKLAEKCFQELETLNLVSKEIETGQFKFYLLKVPSIEKTNIDSVIPIPVAKNLSQSKATETSSSKPSLISSVKTPTLPLKKDPRIKESIDYFFQRCYEIKGFKPEISGASEGRMIKEKLKRYSVDEMKEAFDWFLESEESENLGCTIKLCLSNYIFNKWLAQRVY